MDKRLIDRLVENNTITGVYIVENTLKANVGNVKTVKIGCTTNIEERLKTLNSTFTHIGEKCNLNLLYFFSIGREHMFELEGLIHKILIGQNTVGEWYTFNQEDLFLLLSILTNKEQNNIYTIKEIESSVYSVIRSGGEFALPKECRLNVVECLINAEGSTVRRIPLGSFLKLKKNSLILYCYLQKHSNWAEGEDHRYLKYHALNKTLCCKETGLSFPTLNSKLKYLEEVGLLEIKEVKKEDRVIKYFILPNVGDYYTLVDLDLCFIKAILEKCDERLLRVLLFHKSFSESHRRKRGKDIPYTVTLDYIAESIGTSKNHTNLIIICHKILVECGILLIEKSYAKEEDTGTVRTYNYYTYKK